MPETSYRPVVTKPCKKQLCASLSSQIHGVTTFAAAATGQHGVTFCTAAAGFSDRENPYKRHFLTLIFFLLISIARFIFIIWYATRSQLCRYRFKGQVVRDTEILKSFFTNTCTLRVYPNTIIYITSTFTDQRATGIKPVLIPGIHYLIQK